MRVVPRMPYRRAMQTSLPVQAMLRRPYDPRRVFCESCEHSEFIHGDIDVRRCLYSECQCSGFTKQIAS